MAKITFDLEELRPLIEHAMSCKEHVPTYGMLDDPNILKDGEVVLKGGFARHDQIDFTKIAPHLQLVKDEGIYIMSSGRPNLPGQDAPNKVVYAKGYGPDADYYKVHAVSGDDFVESLDLIPIRAALDAQAKSMVVQLTSSHMYMDFIGGPARAPQPPRERPEYSRAELNSAVRSSGADPKKCQWAVAGKQYKGAIVGSDPKVLYQCVGKRVILHEVALLPTPLPSLNSMATIAYPANANEPASVAPPKAAAKSAGRKPSGGLDR